MKQETTLQGVKIRIAISPPLLGQHNEQTLPRMTTQGDKA